MLEVGPCTVSSSEAIDQAIRRRSHGIMRAQLRADLFDRVVLGLFAQLAEVRHADAVLGHPLLGELAALDVGEDLLHRLARLRRR